MMNALSDPELAKVASERDDARFSRLFLDDNYFNETANTPTIRANASLFGEAMPKRAALSAFLGHRMGRDISPLEYDSVRDGYASAQFGKSKVTDEEMFGLVRGEYEWKQKREAAVNDLHLRVVANALTGAAEGRQTAEIAPVFREWADAHPDLRDGKNDLPFLAGALNMHRKTLADLEDIRPQASAGLSLLQKFTTGQATDADVLDFSGTLGTLSTEQRQKAYQYITLGAQGGQVDRNGLEQFAKNFGESISRSFDFIPKGSLASMEDVANVWLNTFKSGRFSVRENDDGSITPIAGDYYGRPGTRPPTDKEKSDLIAKTESALPAFQIARELKAVARDGVDPLRPVLPEGTLGGTVERGMYGLAGSTGLMAATAINPMVGVMAYHDEIYDRLLVENPDMNTPDGRAFANSLAFVEGAGNAALDRLQIDTITGHLPVLGNLLNRVKSAGWRRTLKIGGNIAEQNLQEAAQDLIQPVLETISAAVRDDMPDKDFSKEMQEYVGGRAETFFAVLPLALIGGGVATVKDIKNPAQVLTDTALRQAGFSENQRGYILQSSSPEEFQGKVQAEWSKRKPADIEAGKKELDSLAEAAKAEQASPETATLRYAGNGEFVVENPDGTEALRTRDRDAALVVLREVNADILTRQTSGIGEAAAYIQKVNEAIGRGEDVQKLLTEQAPRSLLDEYNANPTPENLDRLFETVRYFGEDPQTPGDLAGYFVKASNRGAIKEGIYRSVIRVHEGANGVHVMRDFAQDNLKRAMAEGDVSIDWVRGQLAELQVVKGFEGLRVKEDTDVIEAFSDVAVAYFHGRIKEEQVPTGLRAFLRRMARAVKQIFVRSYRLKRAIAEGKVGGNFQQLLAQSVGLDPDQIVQMEAEKAQRAFEREALDAMNRGEFAQGDELLTVLQSGNNRLPDEKSPFWNEDFARIKEAVREHNKGKKESEKIKISSLFSNDAQDPDLTVIGALQENGFDFFTVDDLVQAVEERIVTGKPVFGTMTNDALQGANYSISKEQDSRYLELAQDPEGNKEELQRMVDEAVLNISDENVDAGRSVMPETGTTQGDVALPLYRYVDGDSLIYPERGMHWTHNRDEMDKMASDSAGFIIMAKHPGYDRVMDWEKSSDRPIMEREIGGYEYRDKVFPEVPIRPGEMEIWSIIKVDEDGNRTQIKSADAVTYDDAGNVIPLSQRFNPASENINYSIGKAGDDRVQRAFEANLKKSPDARLAIYEKAKAKFEEVRARREELAGSTGPEAKFARTLQSLGELDAILKVLPPAIRGKVGGYTTMAKIGQDTISGPGVRPIDKFLEKRIEMIGKELEKVLANEYRAKISKLLEKSLPKKSASGVPSSTLGPETAKYVKSAYAATLLDESAAADRLSEIEGLLQKETDAEKNQALIEEWGIVNLFGGMSTMPAEKLASALDELTKTIKSGREQWRMIQEQRAQEIRGLIDSGISHIGEVTQEDVDNRKNKKGAFEFLQDAGNRHLAPFQLFEQVFGKDSPITKRFSDGLRKASNENNARNMKVRDGFDDAARVALGFKPGERGMRVRFAIDAELAKLMERKEGVQIFHGRKTRSVKIPVSLAEKIVRGELGKSAQKDDALTKILEDDGEVSMSESFLPPLTEKHIAAIREELAMHNERMANRDFQKMDDPNARHDVGPKSITLDLVFKEGTLGPRTMSTFDAMQYLATWGQPDGRAHMERNGFTEESVAQMQEMASSPFARAMFKEMLRQYSEGYNAHNSVYRQLYGVDMPRNQNYSPLTFVSENVSDAPMLPGEMSQSGGMMAGHIKSRTNHRAKLEQTNMANVFWRHFSTGNYWITHALLVRDMRAVLLNRDLMNSVAAKYGPGVATTLKDTVQLFTDGGIQVKNRTYENLFNNIIQGLSSVTLGFKLSSVVNQSDAAQRFSMRLTWKQQVRAISSLLRSEFAKKYARAFNSQTVQQRIALGSNPLVRMQREQTKFSPSHALQLVEAGYLPMQYVDGALTAFSGAVVYESAYLEAKDSGMSDAQSDAFAADEMDRVVFETAQPANMAQKGIEENMGTAWKRGLMMFMSDQRLKFAAWGSAYKGLVTDKQNAAEHIRVLVALGIMGASGELMRAMYRDWFTDDDGEEIWDWKNFARAFLLGPVNGFFFYGTILDSIIKGFTGEKVFSPSNPFGRLVDDATATARNIKKDPLVFVDFSDPEKTMRAWKTAARAAATIDQRAALPAYIVNISEPIIGAKKNLDNPEK